MGNFAKSFIYKYVQIWRLYVAVCGTLYAHMYTYPKNILVTAQQLGQCCFGIGPPS